MNNKIGIIGCGNIGRAIALGLVKSNNYIPSQLILTRRKLNYLEKLKNQDFIITSDNRLAVNEANIIIIAVEPQQLMAILDEIKKSITQNHIIENLDGSLVVVYLKPYKTVY